MSGFDVVRHPTARRTRLAMDPVTGRARLVVPRRASLKAAIAWAEGKADWIAAERARLPEARPFIDGATIPVAGAVLRIVWNSESRARTPRRDGDCLILGGPAETVPARVEGWLRRTALDILTEDTLAVARSAGVDVTRVGIGDPRGRWGSCASGGAIRYSWRLILAPPFVRHATVAHEVAHRIHMNHGPAFHALAAELTGTDPGPARDWLRRHGTQLHWYGRSSG
ncbi:hypothetical protein SAMN05192583_3043 [Sphingomonas gellani]|uniref:YgjP-like metallopeptidase domain-containing protein n=1 Tax=Sphingomonas gellani TaxID=1166340 RepID=A0A1H8HG84_9SPHN|nr:hypothetical protein SAMN05192583_3043 [Sphingomonas gellani]